MRTEAPTTRARPDGGWLARLAAPLAMAFWLAGAACSLGVTAPDASGPADSGLDAPAPDAECTTVADRDGDGHRTTACGGDDCDDSRADVHPSAAEICNGIDDDCNGTSDDPVETDGWCSDPKRVLPHANSICVDGACAVGTCAAGFVDCAAPVLGCERAEDSNNCGTCGHVCRNGDCSAGYCQSDYVDIQVQDHSSCARRGSGQVECWGSNEHGQLGIGTDEALRTTPTPVVGVDDAVGLACEINGYCCVPRRTGAVGCWGKRRFGDDRSPVAVGSYHDARLVWTHTPELGGAGTAAVWVVHGDALDRLDETVGGWSTAPVVLGGLSDVIELTVEQGISRPEYPCLLRATSLVTCVDGRGSLVDTGISEATHIGCNDGTCNATLRTGRGVRWWLHPTTGDDAFVVPVVGVVSAAALGWAANGPATPYLITRAGEIASTDGSGTGVDLLDRARGVSGTILTRHICATRERGDAVCWGENAHGELGDGSQRSSPPYRVVGVTGS